MISSDDDAIAICAWQVGLGAVVRLPAVRGLAPSGGDGSFAPLSVNGTYRAADHTLLSTVRATAALMKLPTCVADAIPDATRLPRQPGSS